MKILFKRTQDEDQKALIWRLWGIVEVILNFLRDLTVPMAETSAWNRSLGALYPLTVPAAFFFLKGDLSATDDSQASETAERAEEVAATQARWVHLGWCLLPGLAMAAYIRMCTYVSQPPPRIFFAFAIIGFVQSIMWIAFTSDIVIDLLQLFGFILGLPKPLLGLTLLAWGNCLGDMNADVAMTKRGFGEMAITGCMAGPIFNILVGMGAANLKSVLQSKTGSVDLSIFEGEGDARVLVKDAVLPVSLIVAQLFALTLIALNASASKYRVSYKFGLANALLYGVVIAGLAVYSLVALSE